MMTPDINPTAYAIRRALETIVKTVLRFAYTAITRTNSEVVPKTRQVAKRESPAPKITGN